MSAPAHSRPFDLAAARAGAPFCGAQGQAVRVLIWDRKHPSHPIIILEEDGEQEAIAMRSNGTTEFGAYTVRELVMLPLGYIEDKPVFVGDKLVDRKSGVSATALATWDYMDSTLWQWPVPPKVYPETKMRHDTMFNVYAQALRERGYNEIAAESSGLAEVANAALRHAVDAGQVVDAEQSAEAIRKAYADGQAIAYKHEDAGRSARDMVVAQAVCRAAQERFHDKGLFSGAFVRSEIESLNLPVIAAGAK